ncbi:hypothetical protein OsccyDRAFT_4585 [Leptolyngbyaceae cyanobacterium JSC-12]|nr:hypothetical protein OsccyDRAFT_4585 [Leptolyngbyaceae cyanobacterium JSC-12]
MLLGVGKLTVSDVCMTILHGLLIFLIFRLQEELPLGSPNAGTFQGRGIVSGSVFTAGRQADTMLNFNANNFSYGIAATAVSGTEVNYQGIITQRRAGSSLGRNGFVLETKVQRFASSANNLRVQNASGSCRIEIFDARVVSSTCNIAIPNSSTRFDGLKQF